MTARSFEILCLLKFQRMMDSSGPETYVPHISHKQVVPEQPRQHESSYYAPTTPETYSSIPVEKERTICGLRPATFVLSVLLATVIVIAAVGGGVGGSLAVQKAKDCHDHSHRAGPCIDEQR
ncbi:hypothetical protein JMJ77_0009181 [Colletotrichum scovillei]|uniref:Uncharacterized protein n=1 Tax=Colletotrichum scovillei TaxID=1209932 RepID=A0A9P7R0P8_9PEZI|nr:hypothetical protein JMJ77_0009181 [Colletotrichum scovillei]KAG7052256.1 hypothetical protein JMJ78_0005277 [Colletotrichum scovillei]KAG7064547.1 hypothetical protein JMJ76_0012310 [Colletotrichum scovillei]